MNNADFEEILRVEKCCQSSSFKYQGVYLWPFIRVILGYNEDLQFAKLNSAVFPAKKNRFQYLINSWNCLKEKVNSKPRKNNYTRLQQKDVMFISFDKNSYNTLYQYKEDKWYSFLQKSLNEENVSFNQCFVNIDSGNLELWSKEQSFYYYENINRRIRKKKVIDSFLSAIDLKERLLEECAELKKIYQILGESKLGITISPGALTYRLESIVCQIKVYSEILVKSRPKIVFFNAFYSDTFMALVYAANFLGIKTVDVQHGVIGPNHFAYIAWDNCFLENVIFPIPKFCFTWNDTDTKYINEGSSKITKAITFGNLSKVLKTTNIKEKIEGSILVTSGYKYIPEDLMKLMNSRHEITWFFRLHPRYTDQSKIEYYREKFLPHINIQEAKEEPLDHLLSLCEFHLTEESAVAWDAYEMGVANIIIGESGKDIFRENIKIKNGFYFYEFENNNFLKFIEKIREESGNNKKVEQLIDVRLMLKEFVNEKK